MWLRLFPSSVMHDIGALAILASSAICPASHQCRFSTHLGFSWELREIFIFLQTTMRRASAPNKIFLLTFSSKCATSNRNIKHKPKLLQLELARVLLST
uniref:Putative secreted protein n=1 Tax=Ixodes ricinus TaxID=34613 RepID=A0A6B0U5M3_IXORI